MALTKLFDNQIIYHRLLIKKNIEITKKTNYYEHRTPKINRHGFFGRQILRQGKAAIVRNVENMEEDVGTLYLDVIDEQGIAVPFFETIEISNNEKLRELMVAGSGDVSISFASKVFTSKDKDKLTELANSITEKGKFFTINGSVKIQ